MVSKRAFDLTVALLIAPLAVVLLAVLWVLARCSHGAPVFFFADRVSLPGRSFRQVKLRSMRCDGHAGQTVMGGDQAHRVTRFGAWLRRTRLDEVPQIWNVLKGEMSLVGPRPLLPSLAAQPTGPNPCPGGRPGLTGLATVLVCGREERLLADCRTAAETAAVYRARCLPVKRRIDRIYARQAGVRLDLYVLYLTAARYVPLPGRRASRLWRDARRGPAQAAGLAAPKWRRPSIAGEVGGLMTVPGLVRTGPLGPASGDVAR